MTHLTWSEDDRQARPHRRPGRTRPHRRSTKVQERIARGGRRVRAAGAGRREVAAQLVDYFMEEAKVVYVIYDVWTAGFLDWLRDAGRHRGRALEAEVDGFAALMALPGRHAARPGRALGGAGRVRRRTWATASAPTTSPVADAERALDDAGREIGAGCTIATPTSWPASWRSWRRRFGEARLEDCYRSVLEPYIQERYMAVRHAGSPVRGDPRAEPVHLVSRRCGRTCAGPSRRATMDLEEHDDRWVVALRPVRLRRALDARRRDRGHGLAGPRAVRVRGHAGAARLGLEQGRHLLLLRALLPHAREAAGRALGPPGPRRRPAAVGRRDGCPQTRKQCQWTVYKTLEAIPEREYERIGR